MIAYGWWMNHFPARPDRFFYRSIHADIGYLVLLLMVFRLIWRGLNPTPALPGGHAALATDRGERQPLGALCRDHPGGAAWLGAFRRPHAELFEIAFGLFHVPQITSPDKVAAGAYEDRHILFAYVLLALIVHPPRGGAVASLRPA